MPNRQNI